MPDLEPFRHQLQEALGIECCLSRGHWRTACKEGTQVEARGGKGSQV